MSPNRGRRKPEQERPYSVRFIQDGIERSWQYARMLWKILKTAMQRSQNDDAEHFSSLLDSTSHIISSVNALRAIARSLAKKSRIREIREPEMRERLLRQAITSGFLIAPFRSC